MFRSSDFQFSSKLSLSCLGAVLMFVVPVHGVFAASAVSINYGMVESVRTVQHEGKHAGGALAGGLLGAAVAGPRHRGLKIATSAVAGAAIQGAMTSGTAQQYTVRLVGGGQSVVTTEQQDIREGDCVAVEQGEHANIRRVSAFHCEQKKQASKPRADHQARADSCQAAKAELVKADADDEVDIAVKKVRILCED